MGERRGTQRVAGATRVLPLRAAALRVPSRPLPLCHDLEAGVAEVRRLTVASAR